MTIGHNSISAQHLESFIKRIERLKEEKAALTVDEREVFREAQSAGFDTKTMREVIKLRALDPSEVAERKAMLELYMEVLNGTAHNSL